MERVGELGGGGKSKMAGYSFVWLRNGARREEEQAGRGREGRKMLTNQIPLFSFSEQLPRSNGRRGKNVRQIIQAMNH